MSTDNPHRTPRAAVQPERADTALHRLTREDRQRLSMDSWEPSLLRELLAAQNELKTQRTG